MRSAWRRNVASHDTSSTRMSQGRYSEPPVMDEVKLEAKRRKVQLLIRPTAQAIEMLKRRPKDTAAILLCDPARHLLRQRPPKLATTFEASPPPSSRSFLGCFARPVLRGCVLEVEEHPLAPERFPERRSLHHAPSLRIQRREP